MKSYNQKKIYSSNLQQIKDYRKGVTVNGIDVSDTIPFLKFDLDNVTYEVSNYISKEDMERFHSILTMSHKRKNLFNDLRIESLIELMIMSDYIQKPPETPIELIQFCIDILNEDSDFHETENKPYQFMTNVHNPDRETTLKNLYNKLEILKLIGE